MKDCFYIIQLETNVNEHIVKDIDECAKNFSFLQGNMYVDEKTIEKQIKEIRK